MNRQAEISTGICRAGVSVEKRIAREEQEPFSLYEKLVRSIVFFTQLLIPNERYPKSACRFRVFRPFL
jgi:hypothetical protein